MFMPQAQPHQLSRSHGPPGTTRRAVRDKENAGALPSKTPVRAPLGKAGPSTGRALGARTVDRNIQVQQPSEDIAPKRLFQNGEGKSAKSEKAGSSSHPLRVKTPGPNRATKTPGPRHHLRTPGPQLRLYHDVTEPTPAPLPSAQRTRRRSRASLQSPPLHHDDAEMSLDSILEADVDVETHVSPAVEEDFELEYAPPTAIDRPYVPEWADSVPDPAETIAALSGIRPMSLRVPPSPPAAFVEEPLPKVKLCPDDELNHPLLRTKPKLGKENQVVTRPMSKTSKDAPVRAPLRPATASGVVRPSTATGAVRPTTSANARTARAPGASAPTAASRASAPTAPQRPASAATTTRAPLRASSSAPSSTSLRPPARTAMSAAASRSNASSQASIRPVRPATAIAVRSTNVRSGTSTARPPTATTTTRPANATATTRPSSRLPAVPSRNVSNSSLKAPVSARATARRSPTPEPVMPVMPETGSDMLDLDFGALDAETQTTLISGPATPQEVAKLPETTIPSRSTDARAEGTVELLPRRAAHASPRFTLQLPRQTLSASDMTSPLMSPRLPSSPLLSEALDFASLVAALPSTEIAPATPEEHIEMFNLSPQPSSPAGAGSVATEATAAAQAKDEEDEENAHPTEPLAQPLAEALENHQLSVFANRRLARISERTEFVDSSFETSFHTSFNASFDDN